MAAPLIGAGCMSAPRERRLFFEDSELVRIRSNARSAFLGPVFSEWEAEDLEVVRRTLDHPLETGDLLSDLARTVQAIDRLCTVYLVKPDAARRDLLLRGLEVFEALPDWDYMLDGGQDVLGLMRSSAVTLAALFSLEVLGDEVPEPLRLRMLEAVAERGCVTCDRTIRHMDNPELATGWGVPERYPAVHIIDMHRWPTILGHNNLRAIPTMGLGLGALAVQGIDDRADEWLDRAVSSARTFLGFFEPDGSYFEGISYVDYAFRTLFLFLEAHHRIHGDIDWTTEANFRGTIEYIACLQNGSNADGTHDIINISDARRTVFPCVPAWIARHTGDPLAQYVATEFSDPGFSSDFLWYDPELPAAPPTPDLLNKRFDLDWIVARTGWADDDTVVAFRSGGPMNHEHADRNSIMVKALGERLLTDPFGASYDAALPHWLLRQTEAHNAVLFDGRGHQYHNGEEGTNAGLAEARIVAWNDGGDVVSWSSDATQGYKLVDHDVTRVMRTVLFVKPNLLVMVDNLVKATQPSALAVRLFPDNRDGLAEIVLLGTDGFDMRRPRAHLRCNYASDARATAAVDRLDLPVEYGSFPFAEILCVRQLESTVVTALEISASPDGSEPRVRQLADESGWTVAAAGREIHIDSRSNLPRFEIS